ncbi:MAG: imidazole glycerol phosphate synthase subunit HisH [Acidobacteriia bacterium]|nr:imidazole glycerol phosphate synthase subunit HisH [Terriglobia bacterium]
MIAIVDYGAGNLNSVKKAFSWLGSTVAVTSQPEVVARAGKIVLPGVGHFSALAGLARTSLADTLLDGIRSGKPFLGICLGMQWLFQGSNEATETPGAGIFPGICKKFPQTVKSPHVGWNNLVTSPGSRLLGALPKNAFVYYTHSFYAPVIEATTAESEYGPRFSAVVEQDSVFGVQFHPEKSGDAGLSILRTFCELESC